MSYAIRFDFPEGETFFAGIHKGAVGWAPTLKTAQLFDDEETAQRSLDNGYGAASVYGRVLTVKAGYPVERNADVREP